MLEEKTKNGENMKMSEIDIEIQKQYDGTEGIDLEKIIDQDITLKLTDAEYKIIENQNLHHRGIGLPFTFIDTRRKGVEVLNVDKFREFLKSMIINFTNCQELVNYNLANSLLTKLDKECA